VGNNDTRTQALMYVRACARGIQVFCDTMQCKSGKLPVSIWNGKQFPTYMTLHSK